MDRSLSKIKEITIPIRPKNYKIVYHLYIIFAEKRDALYKYCLSKGVEAKVHYPKPIYLQNAYKFLKYKKGDFPNAEKIANISLSLPVHEFINKKHIKYISSLIRKFYS